MANTVVTSDIDVFLTDAAWAISTYHTVLKASPGAVIFGQDMLFDIPFLADWNKIGDHKQCQTDLNTDCENHSCHDCDYTVGDKLLLRKNGILRKSESRYECDPCTITSVHMNGTIRTRCRTKSEWLNIRKGTPFLTIRTVIKVIFTWLSPSPTQYLCFTQIMIMTLISRLDTFYTSEVFSTSHTDSPCVGASDIGQESAYTCKL